MRQAQWVVRIAWVAAAGSFAYLFTLIVWGEWGPEWAVPCYPGQGEGPGFHLDILCLAGPPLILLLGAIAVASALGWRLTRPLVRLEPRTQTGAKLWLAGAAAAIAVFGTSVIQLLANGGTASLALFGISVLMTLILSATFKRAFGRRSEAQPV